MALANIRERLSLAYGTRAELAVEPTTDSFRVTVSIPMQERAA